MCSSFAAVMSDSVQPYRRQPTSVHSRLDSPGKHTGVGCHLLLQEIFLTQGLKLSLLCLLHWQAGSSPLAAPSKLHTALNCILVFFSWSCTHTENDLQNLQLQLEGWCPEVTQDPRVPEHEGPQTRAPLRLAGTLKTREHPQGCGDAR